MHMVMRLIGLLLLLAGACEVHGATYAYRNDVFSYDTPSGTANTAAWHTSGASPACTSYPNGDDDFSDVVFANATSPANDFTFTFAGVQQTGVRIYSNGMLAFGNDTSGYWRQYTNLTLPITAASGQTAAGCTNTIPANLIAPYWNDIVAGTANGTAGASVKYELLGTTPNRRFVISWVNVKLYNTTTRYNFQVALYESPAGGLNSNFKYQYTTGSSNGSDATVGVQVSTTDSTLYSFNQSFIDPVAGSAILWYPANQLAGKGAEYRFDESAWNGTAGEVTDTSGSSQNAVRVGAAASTSTGKICRGGSFPVNTSNAVIDAVATPIAPTSVGSIDFWYNSNVKWNSADAMLFDATTTAARPFFFMKTSAGVLKFSVADSAGTVLTLSAAAQTYALNTWHHVGVSWNLRPGTNQTVLQIFLDGVLKASLRTTSSGSIAALSTLNIGDNRTSGVTPTGGTPNSANAVIDEVNVYSTEINATQALADMNATRPNCAAFDHFHIVHSGSLVNCGNPVAQITIEAHDTNHALFTLSGTTVNLSTSTGHGNWSNVAGGSINPVVNNGNGSGSYTFSGEDSVILGLQDSFIESTNINLAAGIYTEHSGIAASCVSQDYTFGTVCDANLSFDNAGFRFVDSAGNNIANQRAGVASGTYYLQAVKSTCTTPGTCTGVCTGLFPSGTSTNVDLAFECNNPTSCQAGQAVTFIPGTGAGAAGAIAGNANGNVSATAGTYTSKALTFNASGSNPTPAVPFTFNYSDVGQIKLWARYPAGGGGSTVSGQSTPFIVAPDHFTFSSVTAAPIKAGNAFSATVTAMSGAATATPNFGKEITAESVQLSHTRVQPTGTGAADGALSTPTFSAVTGGATTASLNWSEVGYITLTANLSNPYGYLGTTLVPSLTTTGTSANIGPFVPDHFDTVVTQGCSAGAFTYSAQPFAVKVTAMNGLATPGITNNYDGTANTSPNFAKAVTLSDANSAAVGGFGTTAAVPASAFALGVATPTPIYTFTNQTTTRQTVPTTIKLRAVDTDSVSSTGGAEGTALIRAGRVKLYHSHGSEILDLPVAMQAQYWSGTSWLLNSIDNCTGDTSLGAANAVSMTLTNVTLAPTATCVRDTGNPGRSAMGCTTAGIVTRQFIKGATPTVGFAGDFNLWLAAPVGGATGAVTVQANVPTWLQFNWTGTVANPTSRATFGTYKGGPVIYMREMY